MLETVPTETEEVTMQAPYAIIDGNITKGLPIFVNPHAVNEVRSNENVITITMRSGKAVKFEVPLATLKTTLVSLVKAIFPGALGEKVIALHALCGRYVTPDAIDFLDARTGSIFLVMRDGEALIVENRGGNKFKETIAALYGREAAAKVVPYVAPPPPHIQQPSASQLRRQRHEAQESMDLAISKQEQFTYSQPKAIPSEPQARFSALETVIDEVERVAGVFVGHESLRTDAEIELAKSIAKAVQLLRSAFAVSFGATDPAKLIRLLDACDDVASLVNRLRSGDEYIDRAKKLIALQLGRVSELRSIAREAAVA